MSKCVAPSMRRSARLSLILSLRSSATLSMNRSVILSMSKCVRLFMSKFARLHNPAMVVMEVEDRLDMVDHPLLEVTTVLLLLLPADRCQDRNVSLSQDNSATMFPDSSARTCPRRPAEASPDKCRDRTARA